MRAFAPAELSGMQRTQNAAMMDTCIIYAHSATSQNAYGKPGATYTAGARQACGYDATGGGEVLQGNETVTVDATFRLPVGTEVSALDRVQLVARFGNELAISPMFEVVGMPEEGPSGIVVNARKVVSA